MAMVAKTRKTIRDQKKKRKKEKKKKRKKKIESKSQRWNTTSESSVILIFIRSGRPIGQRSFRLTVAGDRATAADRMEKEKERKKERKKEREREREDVVSVDAEVEAGRQRRPLWLEAPPCWFFLCLVVLLFLVFFLWKTKENNTDRSTISHQSHLRPTDGGWPVVT